MSRAHSKTFPSLHLSHSSFSNPSVAVPTSQLILQPFRCVTYVTAHSPILLLLLLRHRLFTYVTWRAAHGCTTRIEREKFYFCSTPLLFLQFIDTSLMNKLSLFHIICVSFKCLTHERLARWIKWRAFDVGEAKEGLENELWRRWSNGRVGKWAVT